MRLQEAAVLARFSAGMPGEARQDKRLTAEVKTDKNLGKDAGRWVKRLYPAEALEGVRQIVGRAREKHGELTLPWDDSGYRILPTTTYLEYQKAMRELRHEFEAARDAFNASWSKWVEWAKVEHNGSFNPENYDQQKAFRMFQFTTDFSPIPEGGDFRVQLQEDDVTTLKKELDERLTETLATAQAELWERLATPVRAMVDRLGSPDKIFRNSLVENLENIVALVPKLNIGGDDKLSGFAKECGDKLLKYNATTLRDSPAVRAATAKDADDILRRLEGLMPKVDVEATA
jgi:hypothetical protein